jgi:hypothetical protein
MDTTKTMGLRLPVQAAVNRTATGAALTEGAGVEASINLGDCLKCAQGDVSACVSCGGDVLGGIGDWFGW